MTDARTFLESIGTYFNAGSGTGLTGTGSGIRLATIDPLYRSGLAKVTFDGETQVNSKGYAWVSSYAPVPKERVFLLPVNNSFIIGGAVRTQQVKAEVSSQEYLEFATAGNGFGIQGANSPWDVGPLPPVYASTLNAATFARQGVLNGSIAFYETGIYTVSSVTAANGPPGLATVFQKINDAIAVLGNTTGQAWEIATNGTYRINAGDTLRFNCLFTNTQTARTTVRILKIS